MTRIQTFHVARTTLLSKSSPVFIVRHQVLTVTTTRSSGDALQPVRNLVQLSTEHPKVRTYPFPLVVLRNRTPTRFSRFNQASRCDEKEASAQELRQRVLWVVSGGVGGGIVKIDEPAWGVWRAITGNRRGIRTR